MTLPTAVAERELHVCIFTARPAFMAGFLLLTSLSISRSVSAEEGSQDAQTLREATSPPAEKSTTPEPSPEHRTGPYARFDALTEKGWAVPFPSTADTLLRDLGGVRSALADAGIGFLGLSLNSFTYDVLGRNRGGPQSYNGHKATVTDYTTLLMSYDLSRIGIQGGQLNFGVLTNNVTWAPLGPRASIGLGRLNYYQSLFHRTLELKIGYILQDVEFEGIFVGGNLANGTFGPNAVIPFQVGMNRAPMPTPAANVQINLGRFYNKFAVQRSTSPAGPEAEHDAHAGGFAITVRGGKPLLIEEVGYRARAGQTHHAMWLRAGGIYNFSRYTDFEHGGRSPSNYAAYAAADIQLHHPGTLPNHRGLYAGATVNYAPPDRNIFTQYYEARVYGIGVIPARPQDMISLLFTSTHFSKHVRAAEEQQDISTVPGSNNLTVAYVFHAYSGVYANAGLSYVDNPTLLRAQKDVLLLQLALNLLL